MRFVLLFLFPVFVQAQNLVPNPGFEHFAYCPGGYVQIKDKSPLSSWFSANRGTPDLYNSCGFGAADVPRNWAGTSDAFEGSGYAGIFLYTSQEYFYREFLEIKLYEPLIKDTLYILEFRYKLSSYSKVSVDRIFAHLSDSVIRSKNDEPPKIDPRFKLIKDSAITPETGLWELAKFQFRATGGEQFLTIGNFSTDELTRKYDIRFNGNNEPMLGGSAYYYIDDVRLVPRFVPGLGDITLTGTEIPDTPVVPGSIYTLRNIQFDFNSIKLKGEYALDLDKMLQILEANPTFRVIITGHTDDTGSAVYNQSLSLKRSLSIKTYLISKGIQSDRITCIGKGESKPIVPNTSEEGRRINRRTEVVFQ